MNANLNGYYTKLTNAHLQNLKNEVYSLHLPSEQDEQVMELIEKAFALGGEVGYDEAKSKFTRIFAEFQNIPKNKND